MWISVHDTVDGAKLRKLARMAGCSKGEALGVLTAVWLWGANNANQDGLIRDSTEDDIAFVIMPHLSDGSRSREFVESMIDSGWIDRVDGELYFHDWEDWQAPWYKYLREKEKDTKRRREARRAKREADTARRMEKNEAQEQNPEPSAPAGEESEANPKKPKKAEKPKKKPYAEFVSMTEDEYSRLVEKYGKPGAEKMVEVLDNYKGANGKKYSSDYRAILNWVVKRVMEESPNLIKPQTEAQKQAGGLDDIIPDEWRTGRGG